MDFLLITKPSHSEWEVYISQVLITSDSYTYVGEIISFITAKKPLSQCSYLKLGFEETTHFIWKSRAIS
jgi:hypothetical protein